MPKKYYLRCPRELRTGTNDDDISVPVGVVVHQCHAYAATQVYHAPCVFIRPRTLGNPDLILKTRDFFFLVNF